MNDGKHDDTTKAKINGEKPERSVRKSGRDVGQEISPFATAIVGSKYSGVGNQSIGPHPIACQSQNNSLQ
jgi:hypothetical protein